MELLIALLFLGFSANANDGMIEWLLACINQVLGTLTEVDASHFPGDLIYKSIRFCLICARASQAVR